MKITFRDIVWIVIVTLVVIGLSKCHRDDKYKINEKILSLQAKQRNDSISYNEEIGAKERNVVVLTKLADSVGAVNKSLESRLDGTAAAVIKLSDALRKAKQPGIDTNFISVDQDYVDYCDSLAFKSASLANDYYDYKKNNTNILAAKDEVIKGKDAIITTERQAKQSCLNDYNALLHYYNDYQKSVRKTNQIFIGAELIGNPSYLVGNVGLVLTLKTKTNKLWQISGGLQTNRQYYARINGNILIKLKR